MRILLLNPPAEHTISEAPNDDGKGGKTHIQPGDFGCFPPLGLLYIITYLEKHTSGHELFFLDCVGEKRSHEDLSHVIQDLRPDIVGITSFTISLVDVIKAAKTTRKIVPHAHICMGGHHPIAFPFEAAQLKEFDSIVVGEGEIAFTDLVNAIENGGNITQIPGVYTSESIKRYIGQPVYDKRFLSNVMVPPAYVDDLDTLPIPNRSYIEHIRYNNTVGISDRLATMISSRGCPYHCTYCDVPYKQYRKRSTANVVDEVEYCLSCGYNEFHFYDDLFNITPQRVIGFCDEVERRGLRLHWDFRGRVNTVTKESLVRARRTGCRLISFGVETGSDEGLKRIRKGTTTAKYREVFQWCRELDIRTIADFIIGFPFEKSPDDIRRNIDYLISLDPDYALIGVLMLLPNTEIFREAVQKGEADPQRWIDFSLHPTTDFTIDYWTEYMSSYELGKLQKESYRRFYMRPRYILRSALSVRSFYEFKTKVKGFFSLLR